jgi:hexosaminidase
VGIVYADSVLESSARFLSEYIEQQTGLKLAVSSEEPVDRAIVLSLGEGFPAEGYSIEVTAEEVRIEAGEAAGAFYGVQTLRKAIPAESKGSVLLPAATIVDSPKIEWRGAMLDVARTFFDVAAVERFLDMMALHNLNRFHFHLTDDQGWRIEIKKYPELTEVGAWRKDAEGKTIGGFFTQDELRHIVAYAAERHIEVVPEIDMPGHMVAALAAYPNLGCTGGPYKITGQPGVMLDILCAGSDDVMPFLKDVYAELIEIFPSKYIHIGGDESPRTRWAECPRCQARIKELGLRSDQHSSAEAKLQTWMTAELGEFLAAHGRTIIGWDEILEGGAPDNAVVMSWRGVSGGIEAAQKGHDVIMSPNSSLYFDYYQSADFENEPEAIGSLVTLRDVYQTVLFPTELTTEQNRHIIGVQANLWSTYIPDLDRLDYMALPRMAALSEVAWSYPEPRDFAAFLPRVVRLAALYKRLGYNASERLFDVTMTTESDLNNKQVIATLHAVSDAEIRYTLDGSEPSASSPLYTEPLHISGDTQLRAKGFIPTLGLESKVMAADFSFNKATMRPIIAVTAPDPRYDVRELVDGLQGKRDFTFGHWVGYRRQDLDVAIDLGNGVDYSRVVVRSLHDGGSHIMETTHVEISVSDDGVNFRPVAEFTPPQRVYNPGKAIFSYDIPFEEQTARWIGIRMDCAAELPRDHVFYGADPFVFVDEIQVF